MKVKHLMKLLEKSNPNSNVVIDVDTFKKPLEEINCLDVVALEETTINIADGDGCAMVDSKGQEKYQCVVMLKGEK